jgi:hypothetical protein
MGRSKGSKKYTEEEIEFLLKLIEEIKPIGKAHWDTLTSRYNTKSALKGWSERDSDSLKVKSG